MRRVRRGFRSTLLAGILVAEVGAAIVGLRAFLSRASVSGRPSAVTLVIVVAACAVLTLWTMTAGRVAAQALWSRSEGHEEHARRAWSDRWIDVVFGEAEPPTGSLPQAAVASLLDLRESLMGEPAEMVGSIMREYGIETGLIERLERASPAAGRKVLIDPARTLDRRLEVLDELGRARTPKAVPTLLATASDPEPAARLAGIRALARSVAAIPGEGERRAVTTEVLRVLRDARLSMGALAEAMELLGPAVRHVVGPILEHPHRYGNRMLLAAIDTVGHMQLNDFAVELTPFASSRRREIRLSALHALTKLDRLPAAAGPGIQRAFTDRDPAMRLEAARSAKLLETKTAIYHLEELLCDEDWTVRRVAATTLAGLGGPGIRTLIATSLVHGDHRAHSIATQVLVESRSASQLGSEAEMIG